MDPPRFMPASRILAKATRRDTTSSNLNETEIHGAKRPNLAL